MDHTSPRTRRKTTATSTLATAEPTHSPLDALIDLIADRVADRLRTPRDEMIDQHQSALGVNRHCRLVREGVSRGDPGYAVVGRRCLMSPERHAQCLQLVSTRRVRPAQSTSVVSELERELRLVGRR